MAVRKMAEFDEHDRNEIEDPIALRYVDALSRDVAELNALLPD